MCTLVGSGNSTLVAAVDLPIHLYLTLKQLEFPTKDWFVYTENVLQNKWEREREQKKL